MNEEERMRINRNKRERKRVKSLNKAFQELHELLPPDYQESACTKIRILKDASVYIRYLKLKLQNMEDLEEKTPEGSSDNDNLARPSCAFAEVRSFMEYILSRELGLFNVHISAYRRNKVCTNCRC